MVCPLHDMHILNLAYNVPGPAAAHRLQTWGAQVTKVEPPGGDPLEHYCPDWYAAMSADQDIHRIDLKSAEGQAELDRLLAASDLLITSLRPVSLQRLGLGWDTLHGKHPYICQVAIIGSPRPEQARPGHDLTYLASVGLLSPPAMPRTLLADLAGAERAASTGLALLLGRLRDHRAAYAEVALSEIAADLAEPHRVGLTTPQGLLGGGYAGYRLYPAQQGWIALSALEPAFWRKLTAELGISEGAGVDDLASIFLTRPAMHWEAWAVERNIPLAAVSE